MWPVITLSNGIGLTVQNRIPVKALRELVSPFYRRPVTLKPGQRAELRHWPPGTLTLVKSSSGGRKNFSDVLENPVEGVDYELIEGEFPLFDKT